MGDMAQKIAKVDLGELIRVLNEAFSEEWLAYYQYWIGARVAEGQMRGAIVAEFKEHAHDEREQAEMLADRIIELGGTPVINPDDWSKIAKCKYDAPIKPDTKTLVEQALQAERCAVGRYQGICDMCFGKDYKTFHIAEKILRKEIEHEQEMEDFLKDMTVAKAYYDTPNA